MPYKVVFSGIPDHELWRLVESTSHLGYRMQIIPVQELATPPVIEARAQETSIIPATRESERSKKRIRYVGGRRIKDISAVDLIIEVLNTSPTPVVAAEELSRAFVEHTFAKTSFNGAMTALVRDGTVIRIAPGKYVLPQRYVAPSNNS